MNPAHNSNNVNVKMRSRDYILHSLTTEYVKLTNALSQIQLINNLQYDTEVRYKRAHGPFKFNLACKISILKGIDHFFGNYAISKCEELDKLWLELYTNYGIRWNPPHPPPHQLRN